MNKKSRRFTPSADEGRPAKGPADQEVGTDQVPGYRGQAKSDEPRTAGRGRAKEAPAGADLRRPRQPKGEPDFGDQVPRRRRRTTGDGEPEQYVRLRVRVRGGTLSVIDSHLVDGPLLSDRAFPGSNAYEVANGDRLLHAGALPDLGTQRSFVQPGAPDTQQGHHFTERDTYEFTARVPAHEITPETLGDVEVRLLRVKGEPRADVLSGDRLEVQFEREMRPVAEIRGLPDSVLPDAIEARGARTPRA